MYDRTKHTYIVAPCYALLCPVYIWLHVSQCIFSTAKGTCDRSKVRGAHGERGGCHMRDDGRSSHVGARLHFVLLAGSSLLSKEAVDPRLLVRHMHVPRALCANSTHVVAPRAEQASGAIPRPERTRESTPRPAISRATQSCASQPRRVWALCQAEGMLQTAKRSRVQ